jgi:hypothetical protein
MEVDYGTHESLSLYIGALADAKNSRVVVAVRGIVRRAL